MTYVQKLLVTGLVVLIGGCASGSTPMAPPSVNVTGKWAGTWQFRNPSLGSGQITMDLKQDGAAVTGPMNVSGPTSTQFTNFAGTVSGDSVVVDKAHGSGTLMVKGDQMSGSVFGIMEATVSLQRQK